MRLRISIIIFVFILGCSNNKISLEEKIINNYFKEITTKTIDEKSLTLIIIPSYNCKSCVKKGLSIIDSKVKKKSSNVICIAPKEIVIPKKLEDNILIYRDKLNLINEYNLDIGSINLVRYKDCRIEKIHRFNSDNITDLKHITLM